MKDYDYEILYHLGKANVVTEALIRRAVSTPIRDVCQRMIVVTPILEMIRVTKMEAIRVENRKSDPTIGQMLAFDNDSRGLVTLHGRIWVPYSVRTCHMLLDEAHMSRFSIHLGATNIYHDVRRNYWWPCMQKDIAWFVERYLTYWKVKAKHQRFSKNCIH